MRSIRTAVLILSAAIGTGATTAHAQGWAARHPRRAEVNGRLANQNWRITQGVRDGQLSPAQAGQLRANDRAIRTQERADAAVNGGHITRGEQRQLNREENANSALIYGGRHP